MICDLSMQIWSIPVARTGEREEEEEGKSSSRIQYAPLISMGKVKVV